MNQGTSAVLGLDKGREIIGEKATTAGTWGRFLQTVDTRTGGTDYTCNWGHQGWGNRTHLLGSGKGKGIQSYYRCLNICPCTGAPRLLKAFWFICPGAGSSTRSEGLSTLDGIHRSSLFGVIMNNLIDNCIDQFMNTTSQVDNAIDCWHC